MGTKIRIKVGYTTKAGKFLWNFNDSAWSKQKNIGLKGYVVGVIRLEPSGKKLVVFRENASKKMPYFLPVQTAFVEGSCPYGCASDGTFYLKKAYCFFMESPVEIFS